MAAPMEKSRHPGIHKRGSATRSSSAIRTGVSVKPQR